MNGPSAAEPLLSLARPRRSALRPSTSRRLTSLPSVAPTVSPRLFTTSTISGSGLFQVEVRRMPMSAPGPTAAMGGHFVKISASGPMPTSRYCDHAFCSTSVFLSAAASADPGLMRLRSPPTSSSTRSRMALARAGSPLACSSITRSRRLVTKVTPLAFTAWRSTGASSFEKSAFALGNVPASLPGRSCNSRSWLTVGASAEISSRSLPRTSTGVGPSIHARPTRIAWSASCGSTAGFLLHRRVVGLGEPGRLAALVLHAAQQAGERIVVGRRDAELRALLHQAGVQRADLGALARVDVLQHRRPAEFLPAMLLDVAAEVRVVERDALGLGHREHLVDDAVLEAVHRGQPRDLAQAQPGRRA